MSGRDSAVQFISSFGSQAVALACASLRSLLFLTSVDSRVNKLERLLGSRILQGTLLAVLARSHFMDVAKWSLVQGRGSGGVVDGIWIVVHDGSDLSGCRFHNNY